MTQINSITWVRNSLRAQILPPGGIKERCYWAKCRLLFHEPDSLLGFIHFVVHSSAELVLGGLHNLTSLTEAVDLLKKAHYLSKHSRAARLKVMKPSIFR